MSAAEHERTAANEETSAQLHSAQFNPDASVVTEVCGGRVRQCWRSVANETSQHLEDAKKHRQVAADHRAASQALRDAEASACVGLAADDRDTSPFEHREDIATIQPLTESPSNLPFSTYGAPQSARTVGAVITFRPVPGMTAQWLQRLVDCQLARNAALGHVVPEMPSCPLVPRGVTATVAPTSAGFAVSVRSDDPETVKEILRRARALVGPP